MKLNLACRLLTASLLPLSTLWLSAADAPLTTPPAPTAAQPSQPTTAAQAAQMETVRRQQIIISAGQAVTDGHKLLVAAKYDDAAARFQFAVDSLTTGGISASLYNRACAGLAAAKAGQAQDLAKDTKFAMAATKLQEAIALEPNDPTYTKDLDDLKQQQIAYEKQVQDPEGTVYNPAVTDEFKDRVATVQKLLFQGDAYFKTGQFAKAEETYSKILILDPYNKAARAKMDHMEAYRNRGAEARHEEYEGEKMRDVTEQWAEAISPDIVVPPTAQDQNSGISSNRAKITHKLQSIVIDKVNFDKLDINTVIQFLQQKSKELDPDKQGINFVLRLSTNTATPDAAPAPAAAPAAPGAAPAAADVRPIHREVSIQLDNVPLSELLTYITNQTNLQYSVEDYAVYLRPSIDEGETLTVRTFLVQADSDLFGGTRLRVTSGIGGGPTASTTVDQVTIKVQDQLASQGIRFPNGATATYLPGSSKLVVRDTPEQLDLISDLIERSNKQQPQIQIESKIAEFNQDVLKSLTFQYVFGAFTAGSLGSGTSFGGATALRDANYVGQTANGALQPDSIDTLIGGAGGEAGTSNFPLTPALLPDGTTNPNAEIVAPNSPNVLTIGAVIGNTGMAAVLNAINNTKGVSLVSAPNVTAKSGVKASIDIVQEFPYPTSFEKPKLSTTSVAYSSGEFGPNDLGVAPPLQLALPPTPRDFVNQDVGVSMDVKPTLNSDQSIDLAITKCQVQDFDGFINYGVPIRARLSNDSPPADEEGTVLTEGTENQPVFNLRSMQTELQVLDGQTAVLGGLLREDTQDVNDKVPVLGDLPLVGRLFQSKVTERTKKNLLIFITARLIRTNGKPVYLKTLDAEPEEEKLEAPDQQVDSTGGVTLPPLPEGTPNS